MAHDLSKTRSFLEAATPILKGHVSGGSSETLARACKATLWNAATLVAENDAARLRAFLGAAIGTGTYMPRRRIGRRETAKRSNPRAHLSCIRV